MRSGTFSFMPSVFIINSKEEKERFSKNKVFRSVRRSGGSKKEARQIVKTISSEVYPGIKTSKIFSRIKELLKNQSPKISFKFSLKEGMRKLGPTGFPFEKYIKNILNYFGYEVEINQFLSGKCLSNYEIDFIARKGNIVYVGECKYRHRFGERIHYHEALINHARFLDIIEGNYFKSKKYKGVIIKSMMATNAKFSEHTKKYAACVGTELLGWNYPKNKGLEYLIDKKKLYPITVLPAFKGRLGEAFVQEKKMLAQHILETNLQNFAKKHKLSLKQLEILAEQAEILLK